LISFIYLINQLTCYLKKILLVYYSFNKAVVFAFWSDKVVKGLNCHAMMSPAINSLCRVPISTQRDCTDWHHWHADISVLVDENLCFVLMSVKSLICIDRLAIYWLVLLDSRYSQ